MGKPNNLKIFGSNKNKGLKGIAKLGESHLYPREENLCSSVNGRFRVKTTEVRRVHVHSSLLVVTSNQNASNKKKKSFKYIP
jgi:hypothetical protein